MAILRGADGVKDEGAGICDCFDLINAVTVASKRGSLLQAAASSFSVSKVVGAELTKN